MQSEVKPTALEEKWEKNKSSGPSLDDAYSEDGKIKEGGVSEEIMSLILENRSTSLSRSCCY